TVRPADLLEPELEKYREECKDVAKSEEDVLSYALFPQVASKFFETRDKKAEEPVAAPAQSDNGVRTLYVQDLS
ncbi:MAG: oxaloacetate decarboxylase subunit alpha, partial [Ruminococcaceae bacterium]|nr:oxaloacetate decarboxylase subunit alpha [Oscillospiraceae bacterium]